MGSEEEYYEPSSTPKLSLFSLPSKPPEPPDMLTPPLQSLASIPFQWEEAPGKPRAAYTSSPPPSNSKTARCLDLPPRLLAETKVTNMPSPTTVLDGPYPCRTLSQTLSLSFRKGSFRGPDQEERLVGDHGVKCRKKDCTSIKERSANFSSWRWGSFRENRRISGDSFGFSASAGGAEDDRNVKVSRVRRSSFFGFSRTNSNLLASIYGSFKLGVPWKRTQENKLRKMRLIN